MADPKTPRPPGVEFDNGDYTNPKYAGTVWYIADHLKDPSKPIVPLALVQPQRRQLNAKFIDDIADARNHGDKRQTTSRSSSSRASESVDLRALVGRRRQLGRRLQVR